MLEESTQKNIKMIIQNSTELSQVKSSWTHSKCMTILTTVHQTTFLNWIQRDSVTQQPMQNSNLLIEEVSFGLAPLLRRHEQPVDHLDELQLEDEEGPVEEPPGHRVPYNRDFLQLHEVLQLFQLAYFLNKVVLH